STAVRPERRRVYDRSEGERHLSSESHWAKDYRSNRRRFRLYRLDDDEPIYLPSTSAGTYRDAHHDRLDRSGRCAEYRRDAYHDGFGENTRYRNSHVDGSDKEQHPPHFYFTGRHYRRDRHDFRSRGWAGSMPDCGQISSDQPRARRLFDRLRSLQSSSGGFGNRRRFI